MLPMPSNSRHARRFQKNKVLALACASLLMVILFRSYIGGSIVAPETSFDEQPAAPGRVFHLAFIADMDTASKIVDSEGRVTKWKSIWLTGELTLGKVGPDGEQYTFSAGEPETIVGAVGDPKGRGMELSELLYFNERLLTFDDRTGTVFEIPMKSPREIDTSMSLIPRYTLTDGDGYTSKGFKTEWATVKEGTLYAGSLGKEWTDNDGNVKNHNPQYVKTIDSNGKITSLPWQDKYNAIRKVTGFERPGYIIHEAANWREADKSWYFLPRRASTGSYNEKEDEFRGTNYLIKASEDFSDISYTRVGEIEDPRRGYSSFKFLPGTNGHCVALKTEEEEDKGYKATYITVFNLKGDVLMKDILLDSTSKFEGVEIIY